MFTKSTQRQLAKKGGVLVTEPIYVDRNGARVGESDPGVVRQLFGAGSYITQEQAATYGVAYTEPPKPEPQPTIEDLRISIAGLEESRDLAHATRDEAIIDRDKAIQDADDLRAQLAELQAALERKDATPDATPENKDATPDAAPENKDGAPNTETQGASTPTSKSGGRTKGGTKADASKARNDARPR